MGKKLKFLKTIVGFLPLKGKKNANFEKKGQHNFKSSKAMTFFDTTSRALKL